MNVSPPWIWGYPQQGEVLAAYEGEWYGPDLSFGYQWQRCDWAGENCWDVWDAWGPRYELTWEDVDYTIRVVVTAWNEAGSAWAISPPTDVVVACCAEEGSAPVTTAGSRQARLPLSAGPRRTQP